jgi:hypothetical protein
MEVLRKEEEHRQLHKRGECQCEVIFDAEERERRLRSRGGKGKGKGKEVARIEYTSQHGGEDGGHHGHTTEEFPGTRPDITEAGPSRPQQDWVPQAQMATYQYVGYQVGGRSEQISLGQEQGDGVSVGGGNSQISMFPTVQRHRYPVSGGVGRMDLDQVAAGHGFPVGGFAPREYLWEGQMEIGQDGAGMKWYPQQDQANMPGLPDPYSSPSTRVFDKMPREWQRAKSEPAEEIDHTVSPTIAFAKAITFTEPEQPVVVSSDMGKL